MSEADKKAKELIEKFYKHTEKVKRQAGDFGDFKADYKRNLLPAKLCALICIEEILNSGINDVAKNLYWSTVKTLIQNYE